MMTRDEMNNPKRIDWKDTIGKTVTGAHYEDDEALVVVFGDEFALVARYTEYDSGGMKADEDALKDSYWNDTEGDEWLMKAGALTGDDIKRRREERRVESLRKLEESKASAAAKELEKERAEFERLKAKFGESQ